jgi:transcriptional regulator with XRE-family HTH domain
MTYPPYLREKARQLRIEKKMSLDDIAARLALNRTTVWYWIEDLPDPEIKHRLTPGRRRALAAASAANKARFKARRDAAYKRGRDEFAVLDAQPGFRDFICMYIGEGYKRNRNVVSIANSDPRVIRLANHWICRFSANKITYSLQYHADQDPDYLIRFWSTYLGAPPERFVLQRKSNSGQLNGRNWRSRWGVLSVTVGDTQLRARLQGWIDRVQNGWIDSIVPNIGA